MKNALGVRGNPAIGAMMWGMKTVDPHAELHEGFQPAPNPAIGQDGGAVLPARRSSPHPRPSLCRAGPCVHYHRLVVQVEAENPRAVLVPIRLPHGTPGAERTVGGTLYQAPAVFHTETHHYCYPGSGIEMPLGELPVVECNLHEPRVASINIMDEYRASVAAWEAERSAEASDVAEAEQLIETSLAESPEIACQACGRRFPETELDIEMRCGGCRSRILKPRTTSTESP